jgi:hypothetical protein
MSDIKAKCFFVLALLVLLVAGGACTQEEKQLPATLAETQPPTAAATLPPTEASTAEAPTATPAPTSTPIPPTPAPTFTPTPVPMGGSRSNPILLGQVHQTVNWELQVLEVKRGDVAWADIQVASRYNDPPSEGMEYVLVRMRAKNISKEDVAQRINRGSFALTGGRNLVYQQWVSLRSPEPELNAELYPEGEVEGWITMLAIAGDTNLVLMYKGGREEGGMRFFALDGEGIPARPVEPCAGISTTTRSGPAPFGETVCVGSWEIRVLEVIRGVDAWLALQAASDMNDPPKQGMEYVLIKLHAKNVSSTDEPIRLSEWDFRSIGDKNVVYDTPSVYFPSGPEIGIVEQFPGGESEGWLAMECAEGEGNLVAIFESDYEAKAFLALE